MYINIGSYRWQKQMNALWFWYGCFGFELKNRMWRFFLNSGRFSLVLYTKDFRRITHFWGNDLATVPISALCCELLSLLLVLTQRYEDFSIHTQSSKKKEWEKCYLQINIRYLFLYLNLFARILLYSSIIA